MPEYRDHPQPRRNSSQRPVSTAEYNDYVAKAMSEDTLQKRVEELLRLHRWEFFHDQDSRRNRAGLPDTIAVRRGRLLFAELKSQTGRTRSAQKVWAHELELVVQAVGLHNTHLSAWPCPVQYHLWRPADLLAGRIAEVLK
jgi:hypothetical protein